MCGRLAGVMDRTCYGKWDPGARQPYRCTLRERGIAPGCELKMLVNKWFDLVVNNDLLTINTITFGNSPTHEISLDRRGKLVLE